MNITGTLMNYYVHCERQCYLFGNRINLENNSQRVMIGKALHEQRYNDASDSEISIDHIKLDKIKGDYLIELKKSDADSEASKWQVIYYLKVLKEKGIIKKGKLEFIEKNKTKSTIIIELTEDIEKELEEKIVGLKQLLSNDNVPKVNMNHKCKHCAYYEYCCI